MSELAKAAVGQPVKTPFYPQHKSAPDAHVPYEPEPNTRRTGYGTAPPIFTRSEPSMTDEDTTAVAVPPRPTRSGLPVAPSNPTSQASDPASPSTAPPAAAAVASSRRSPTSAVTTKRPSMDSPSSSSLSPGRRHVDPDMAGPPAAASNDAIPSTAPAPRQVSAAAEPSITAATTSAGTALACPPLVSASAPAAASAPAKSEKDSSGAGTGTVMEKGEVEAAKEKQESDPYARPGIALSVHLLELYKMVNARYCEQRRLESPGPKYNSGYDDKEGHYLFLPGEVVFQRYIAQEVLGKGSFGTVIRGYDQKRSEAVAMKITRRGSSFRSQAKLELDILLRLNENPALNHLVVRLLKVFEWQGHLVLVFELLSFNLYQLIKCTRYHGVSLDLVRKFAYQLTHTLLQLESQKPYPIIHCDVKPENILLRNQNRSGIRLIDFGSACYTAKRFHRYIQSRFYRSPEVILYLEYGTAIDRWSLACVLVELHTGMPLFDGRTEAAQLARLEAMLGPLPATMIAASPKAGRFYNGSTATGFQLKEPAVERRTLETVLGVTTGGPSGRRLGTPGHDEAAYRDFLDFASRLLRYTPSERLSCRDALQHPFLMPLYTSDLQQQQERAAQHSTSPPKPSAAAPSAIMKGQRAAAQATTNDGKSSGGGGNALRTST